MRGCPFFIFLRGWYGSTKIFSGVSRAANPVFKFRLFLGLPALAKLDLAQSGPTLTTPWQNQKLLGIS
jgi:hypothetical protein